MYIKNRRDSPKFKGFGLYQNFCLTESLVLRMMFCGKNPAPLIAEKRQHQF